MATQNDYHSFQEILDLHGIKKLYHFTDRDNLESIIKQGGLYSWADCEAKNIRIPKPGGAASPGTWIEEITCSIMSG